MRLYKMQYQSWHTQLTVNSLKMDLLETPGWSLSSTNTMFLNTQCHPHTLHISKCTLKDHAYRCGTYWSMCHMQYLWTSFRLSMPSNLGMHDRNVLALSVMTVTCKTNSFKWTDWYFGSGMVNDSPQSPSGACQILPCKSGSRAA